jgi:murein DD-endopeptidase MepM/ murein hydrolase activator NlpD
VPYHPDDPFDEAIDEGFFEAEDDDSFEEADEPYLPVNEHLDRASPRALIAADVNTGNGLVPSRGTQVHEPVLIPGTGKSLGTPFIKRRKRPLSMRLAMVTVLVCLVASGLLSVVPLSTNGGESVSAFQVLAGAVVSSGGVSYFWYTAQSGDDLEILAAKFNVQIGGILELNSLPPGQELQIGKAYKIPNDPNYGKNYQPETTGYTIGSGTAIYGSDWYNSYTGPGRPEEPCAPNGGTNPLGYHFQSPNWGSAWVRGFSWYHNGDDISAPNGNPIRAAQSGLVTWAGWTNTGFGYSIVISHCYNLATLYGHMQALNVKAGDYVTPGQIIGLEGMTGWATGPHLHFSVIYYNQLVDPMAYFTSIVALTTKP